MRRNARSTEQKQERRAEILSAATSLLTDREYDQVQMADIGQAAGVAKGTLYLYFPTKEALFLEVLGDRIEAVLSGVSAELESQRRWSCDRAADLVTDRTCADPLLIRLLVLLHGVLERNVEVELAVRFKLRLLAGSQRCAEALSGTVEGLSPAEAGRFLVWFYATTVGLGGMAHPARAAALAMAQRPELLVFKPDLKTDLTLLARAALRTARTAGPPPRRKASRS
jgi:AcrR family transcriptional regulator